MFCNKESEEACKLIWINFGSFAITYLIMIPCFKNFIFQQRLSLIWHLTLCAQMLADNTSCNKEQHMSALNWSESYINSVQNSLMDFDYFLLLKINRFINKVINILSCVIYYLTFPVLHITFRRHKTQ